MPPGKYKRTKLHGLNISKAKKGKRTSIVTEFKLGYKANRGVKVCHHCKNSFEATHALQKWCQICAPNKKFRFIVFKYKISYPEYLKMLEETNGLCPICQKREAIRVDHNHVTGKVRGILCGHCNISLPLFEDPKTLERAIKYINRV